MSLNHYRSVLTRSYVRQITRASNELFISELLTNDPITSGLFRGTFSIDERVKKPIYFPSAYVFNTHPRRSRIAGHWICMYAYKHNRQLRVEFFDSYGTVPPAQLLTLAYEWTRRVSWNRLLFQDYFSALCGMYVVYYLHYRSRGWTMTDIQDHFNNSLLSNDKLVSNSVYAMMSYS